MPAPGLQHVVQDLSRCHVHKQLTLAGASIALPFVWHALSAYALLACLRSWCNLQLARSPSLAPPRSCGWATAASTALKAAARPTVSRGGTKIAMPSPRLTGSVCRLLPLELCPRRAACVLALPWPIPNSCCQQVLDYSVGLSRLWPDLEQSMRANDLDWQLSPNGRAGPADCACMHTSKQTTMHTSKWLIHGVCQVSSPLAALYRAGCDGSGPSGQITPSSRPLPMLAC